MKKLKINILLLKIAIFSFIVIFSYSCQQGVTFTEPQPINTKNLKKIPKKIQGEYLSLSDNSILKIDNKYIKRIYKSSTKIHIKDLDSNLIRSGDSLLNIQTNDKYFAKINGDSLICSMNSIIILFELNNENILKKFKGYYFINTYYGENNWKVRKVKLSKNELIISQIKSEEEIKNLQEIIENPDDTITKKSFSPTKKEFKNFIENNGFNDNEIFIKQK